MTRKARSDRRENRLRIIEAARAVFAEQGFDTPLAVIASRAGVSRMTLSRHFADREFLGIAIFEDNVANIDALSKDWAGDDEGYLLFLNHLLELCAQNVGLTDALLQNSAGTAKLNELRRSLATIAAPLLERAKVRGLVRQDMQDDDLSLLIDLLLGALRSLEQDQRLQRARRALDLLLDGVRGRPDDRA